jgi:hypothetical protein
VLKFGPLIARQLRQGRPRPSARWHFDEMVVRIAGKRMYLWRAVDNEGEVLDIDEFGRTAPRMEPSRRSLVARDESALRSRHQGFARCSRAPRCSRLDGWLQSAHLAHCCPSPLGSPISSHRRHLSLAAGTTLYAPNRALNCQPRKGDLLAAGTRFQCEVLIPRADPTLTLEAPRHRKAQPSPLDRQRG